MMKYTCAICNSEFDKLEDRIICETKCFQKQKEEDERLAKELKEKEREARKEEVDIALDKANELLRNYIKDYGSYCRSAHKEDKNDFKNDYHSWLKDTFWLL